MGRRVQKQTQTFTAGVWTDTAVKHFVYDGWNVVKETTTLAGQPPASKYYIWGLDLSQSRQGAGGIGGLLAVIDNGTTHNFCYDANGNVGQLVNAATGTITAHYEYQPFGELIHSYGDSAGENGYRFSTKYFDGEAGLYYYGYRYYSPQLGRWINRDPIGERGGLNLYGFVNNSPTIYTDNKGHELQFVGDKVGVKLIRAILKRLKLKANDELKEIIERIEKDKRICKVGVVWKSDAVVIGDYELGQIDLYDLNKFKESVYGATIEMLVIHEIVEQWEKQINGKLYPVAHKEAIKAEALVDGNIRIREYPATRNILKLQWFTFTSRIEWKRNIEIVIDGKKKFETRKTVQEIEVRFGDIINVREYEGELNFFNF